MRNFDACAVASRSTVSQLMTLSYLIIEAEAKINILLMLYFFLFYMCFYSEKYNLIEYINNVLQLLVVKT